MAITFSVFDSFQPQVDAETFDFAMPEPEEKPKKAHAALIVGFDDRAKNFKVRNSQGEKWGNGGYSACSYEFVMSSHVTDFWTLIPNVGSDG